MQDNTRRTLVLIVVAVAIGLLYYTSTELLGIGDSPASDDSAQSAGDTGGPRQAHRRRR
ncbi:MAG: hypothetical protein R3B82_21465 [Sandaracinaceae bacterium]